MTTDKRKPTVQVLTPGGVFTIKRSAQINGVPATPQQLMQTVKEIQDARGAEQKRDELGTVIRFRRAGIEIEITPDPSQIAAVNSVKKQQLACITGAAGTGKTTVERILLMQFEQGLSQIDISKYGKENAEQNQEQVKPKKVPSIAFAAFTGKAMQQMKRNLPEEYQGQCFTIHYLLGFYPLWYDEEIPLPGGKVEIKSRMKFVPWYTAACKLPWRIIVLDEASMIPIDLWNMLIDACHPDTRIILIGDINQLPPVMGRSVFGYALLKWPAHELTQIHRQKGEDNPIVDNAWRILQGQIPKDVPGKFDMIACDRGSVAAMKKLLQVTILMQRKGLFVPMRENVNQSDMIIVPQNVGEVGQIRINEMLIPHFNPVSENPLDEKGRRKIIQSGFEEKSLAIGDKVMATVNDYSVNVTNGMIGRVIGIVSNDKYVGKKLTGKMEMGHISDHEIDGLMNMEFSHDDIVQGQSKDTKEDLRSRAASHIVTVDFGTGQDGQQIIVDFSTAGQVNSLILANAATCHKFQGSECPTVIVMCHSAAVSGPMLTREWLYTAVTRASERVVLIYDNRGLANALNRQRIKGKNLKEKAQAFNDWQREETAKKDDGFAFNLPVLWEPREIV